MYLHKLALTGQSSHVVNCWGIVPSDHQQANTIKALGRVKEIMKLGIPAKNSISTQ